MISTICHHLIKWYTKRNYTFFSDSLKNPEEAQLRILKELTGFSDYEFFQKKFPITTYENWKDALLERKQNEYDTLFVPTSGSTHAIKWIPYTIKFKAELWSASSSWMHDLYLRYPAILRGKHYWSLSWLPENMRHEHTSNDLDFFAGLEKYFLSQTMALSSHAAKLPTLKESMRENVLSLIQENVTLISIWSPTFLLELLDLLMSDKDFFLGAITNHKKHSALKKAANIGPELTKILFPKLVLISSWATASSKFYAEKIQLLFPNVAFEEKGLWATEGVVTIPFNNKFPLAIASHFYEFEEVDGQKILPSWKLEKGMKVTPLLTTGSGLIRYRLNDLLEVSDFYERTPCLSFLGRRNEADLVGEKISSELAAKLIEEINHRFNIRSISLLAVQGRKPGYRLLVEGVGNISSKEVIEDFLESRLQEHFHYKLARELGQLEKVKVEMHEEAYSAYVQYAEKKIALKGSIKVEALMVVSES